MTTNDNELNTERLEDAKALRAMIKLWVNNYPSKNNLRMRQLSESSIYSNRKVFDDYSFGIKSSVTIITEEIESGIFKLQHNKNFSKVQEKENMNYPGGLFYAEEILFDQDFYDKNFRKIITKILSSDIYKKYFLDKTEKSTKKYLNIFNEFSNEDYKHGHKKPFANLYLVETHISLAYNFAQYLEDKVSAKPDVSNTGKQNGDFLRLNEYKKNLSQTLKEITSLQKRLSSSEAFGERVNINQTELEAILEKTSCNLTQKHNELSRYKRSDKTICERLLANRLATDILSLELYRDIYRRPTEYTAMARFRNLYDGYQEIHVGDLFLAANDIPYTDLESCSYAPPFSNTQEFQTELKDNKSLEVKSIIRNWCIYILGKVDFEDIVDAAVDSIIKPTNNAVDNQNIMSDNPPIGIIYKNI